MASFTIPHVQPVGLAALVPTQVVDNQDYDWISPTAREQVIKTTGVARRRFFPPGTLISQAARPAVLALTQALGWDLQSVDLLVLICQTPDYLLPNTGIRLQDQLGLGKHCMAFDIPLGCSGYVYGLSVASSLLSHGGMKRGLLVAGDICTWNLAYRDQSTYPLFGDAVTVTALEYAPNARPQHYNLQSDGAGWAAIHMPTGGLAHPFTPEAMEEKEVSPGIWRTGLQLSLDGLKVFEFALREVAKNARELLTPLGKTIDADVDYLVMHQANRLMLETVRKQLKTPPEKVPYSLEEFGNTSSASIPLTLVHALGPQTLAGPQRLLLSGFGIGLSWGSVWLESPGFLCLPLLQADPPPPVKP